MNEKVQAAFEMLYLISAIDGEVGEDEARIVCTTLTENYRPLRLDPLAVLESLRNLSESQRLERFQAAAEIFANNSDGDERRQLLATAIELATTDGEADARAQSLVGFLETHWGRLN